MRLAATQAAEPERFRAPETREGMLWLARSNYELKLTRDTDAAEVVIFPLTSNESRGIEDLRMVRFVDDDGSITFFGTYTATDGRHILPQFMETRDFLRIGIHTLNGAAPRTRAWRCSPAASAVTT